MFFLYVATWTVVALTPGPAVFCAMAQATRHGFRSSLAGVAGIQAGNALFFLCVALGLATLLATASTAFSVLRMAGAIYLFYLGVRIIVSTLRRNAPVAGIISGSPGTAPSRRGLFWQGLLIQVTNPKALLFVSALLPQFLDQERPVLLQLAILMAATVAVDFAVLSGYALFAERGAKSFRASRFSIWLERFFGAALVFFGLKLLLARK